ncbi:hypothetical protein ACFVOR_14780 [Streptomyces sp. NPDC057837]|uniref:hypothetical protein n=1 Tax=Streptomyces sp. NPDC057837 TaxID=3346260 RepID=UPI0036A9BF27
MIADAIGTVITLGWALAAWIAVLAAVASIVLLSGTAAGMWAGRLLWRTAVRPAWARGRLRARLYARRTRPDYEEAA